MPPATTIEYVEGGIDPLIIFAAMSAATDYLKAIQKFTTSHYWNAGVRITVGVLIPLLLMAYFGWLSIGIPFLLSAVFIGIVDSPGPIHHRINGMLIALGLNTLVALIVGLVRDQGLLLLPLIVVCSFLFSMIGVYGARASSVGTLALIMLLLNMSPDRTNSNLTQDVLLVAAGGIWYFVLSVLLYRLQPYRIVEQALGEYLSDIAQYLKARAAFYKTDADPASNYNRVMQEQVVVINTQTQVRELLFKTRQLVQDASPKSRSMMLIYLEATELFEETMYSYYDYDSLKKRIGQSSILTSLYSIIIQIVAELEYAGFTIQSGGQIKKNQKLNEALDTLNKLISAELKSAEDEANVQALSSVQHILHNLKGIIDRIDRIARFSRLQLDQASPGNTDSLRGMSSDLGIPLLIENLSLQSNHFRFALRIAISMVIGYTVSVALNLSHAYWVLLTIVTIMKPAYQLARKRNLQRVAGTFTGVGTAALVFFLTDNDVVLFVLLIVSMLFAYSFLRVNYFAFVSFLTFYIIISFYFLNPGDFRNLMGERLIDTLLGSIIAATTTRILFPVWQRHSINAIIDTALKAQIDYLTQSLVFMKSRQITAAYKSARNEAIISLTNLSDSFQQMLSEPVNMGESTSMHQLVITIHSLTSRLSAIASQNIPVDSQNVDSVIAASIAMLQSARKRLSSDNSKAYPSDTVSDPSGEGPLNSIFYLCKEIRTISFRMASGNH